VDISEQTLAMQKCCEPTTIAFEYIGPTGNVDLIFYIIAQNYQVKYQINIKEF